MGCNESKQDVATGNTIPRKKSDAGESKNDKDIETILETGKNDNNTNSLVQQEGENVNNNVVAGGDIKDIAENKAKEEQEPGSLVSKESPNRYFSSRKDEEALEGIASEGRSEKSEYCSPHVEAGKESLFNENVKENDVVEEKKLVEETKEETKTEEASIVKEENLVKEAEVATTTTTEANVSTPRGEEKSLDADKEHSADSPAEDVKTN